MSRPTLILAAFGENMFDYAKIKRFYNIVHTGFGIVSDVFPTDLLDPSVAQVVNAINQTEGKFALAGFSFGARVISQVYDELRTGSLQDRNNDFLGAISGGSPCREAGHTFPGATDPGGHGIAENRLVGSEEKWWEFARKGDIISVTGDDTGGLLATAVYEWIYGNYQGAWNEMVAAVTAAFNTDPVDVVTDIVNEIIGSLTWGIPHATYGLYYPIPGDRRNTWQIATDYLITLTQGYLDDSDISPAYSQLADIERAANLRRAELESLRRSRPIVRFWMNNPDGSAGLTYVGRVDIDDSIRGSFPFKNNIPSQGILELRDDHYMAIWLKKLPNDSNLKKNVVITVDFFGGKKRWSGLLDKWTVKTKDQAKYLEVTFNDDLTMLQFLLCPPNPFLPIPVFQFPRIFPIAGPAKWAISMVILLNLLRVEGNLWQLPDDPFEVSSWVQSIDWSTWQCLIKADPFLLDDSSIWTFLASRMNPVDSVIADALDDAQLTLTYRRIITDDGELSNVPAVPNVQNGTLVFEVVDNSNATALEGTFFQGTIVDGMVRSVIEYVGGFVEDLFSIVGDDQTLQPDEYYTVGWLSTVAKMPWLVVRDSEWTQIESSDLSWGPSKNVSVIVGGDNPAADALVKLLIETVGNLIGYIILVGFDSAGTIASDLVMPFLVGTILAWLQWKNTGRATELGWVHYWELYQQGAENNAWSLSGLNALRGGFLVGKSETVHTIALHDSWVIPGVHIDIGQRFGSTVNAKGIEEIIWVNQLQEMTPAWDNSTSPKPLSWVLKAGKSERAMTMGERLARLIGKLSQSAMNLGVNLIKS